MLNLLKAIVLTVNYIESGCSEQCSREAFMAWFLDDERWDEGFVSWQEIAYANSQRGTL